jgi:hypothetical protein
MNHLSEDELVLLQFGDANEPDIQRLEGHVARCPDCRREFERLRMVMDTIMEIPEPAEGYEREVWHKLRPLLPGMENRTQHRWFAYSTWAAAAAMAAVVVLAFLAGRSFQPPKPLDTVSFALDARARTLLLAVGAHLDRVQIMLTELANKSPAEVIDISAEQDATQTLLPDNRLYRETATQLNDVQIATLLDELERLLLDVSHRPAVISLNDFHEIRDRIESEGILFKVRVAGSELRSRQTNRGL